MVLKAGLKTLFEPQGGRKEEETIFAARVWILLLPSAF
jgi:hypothetical protein